MNAAPSRLKPLNAPVGAETRSFKPASAGLNGSKSLCVSQRHVQRSTRSDQRGGLFI